MMTDPGALTETYFQAWQGQDFDTLRSVLAENATFRGPLGAADNADECIAGLRGMSKTMTGITVLKRLVDGLDVVTMFELHTADAPACLTANWSHVEDGKITSIRVAFDPRPLIH